MKSFTRLICIKAGKALHARTPHGCLHTLLNLQMCTIFIKFDALSPVASKHLQPKGKLKHNPL
ncbi:MAG: hypothetical protein D6730_16855 [Bacteroidetes bacterium]|nr:MAG: hypothetical protein D6730_16855 [Bacteroidota bacterium]